jgi:DNA-binding winged helix-turn-helix (wHTH) protein
MEVHPATRQLIVGDRHETLEPRVMQVLVALFRAGGIVTRDELIARCWDGRIVSDDAINRVLTRVRQAAADIGQGSISIETITKVGYRLSISGERKGATLPAAPARKSPGRLSRRGAIVGAIAVTTGATLAGVAAFRGNPTAGVSDVPIGPAALRSRRRRSAEATELLDRTIAILMSGRSEDYQQAVAYMAEATRLEPNDPELLGALALAFAAARLTAPASERDGYAIRA